MGKLHDRLEEIGYTGHPLEVYLVRVLFLLFAEDTTIFNKQQFQDFLEQRTNEDGSDLAAKLQELFLVISTCLIGTIVYLVSLFFLKDQAVKSCISKIRIKFLKR